MHTFTPRQQQLRERNRDKNGININGSFDLLTVADLQDWTADYLSDGTIRILDGDWSGTATIHKSCSGFSEHTKSPRLYEMARAVNYSRSDDEN